MNIDFHSKIKNSSTPVSVIAVGLAGIDIILDLPRFPQEDEKIRSTNRTIARGGNAANICEIIAQFSPAFRASLIAPLSSLDDSDSKFIHKNLVDCNIDTAGIAWRSKTTQGGGSFSAYVLRCAATQSRTIIGYRQQEDLSFSEFKESLDQIKNPLDWVHFEGRSPNATLEMINHLKQKNPKIRISVDLEKHINPNEHPILLEGRPAFVVFSSQWVMQNGFGKDVHLACTSLIKQGYGPGKKALWVFTQGQQGSICFEFENSAAYDNPPIRNFSVKPPENISVIDTVGAGDTFLAGLILALSQNIPNQDSVEFATYLAALKVSRLGFSHLAQSVLTGL